MGSRSASSSKKPKPLGIDENKLSSNESAKPVPYPFGRVRYGVTFISELFDVRKESVSRDAGAKKPIRTGTSYFGSFLALIGHGPLDAIYAIWLNGERVWPANNTAGNAAYNAGIGMARGAEPYVDITIEDYGEVRVYWGTEEQERDDYTYFESGDDHPAYRGFAYLRAKRLFFGFNQTNVQNFEVEIGKFPALTGSPSTIGRDANPANVIYDLLTSRRVGPGVTDEEIDVAAVTAVGAQLAGELMGLSGVLVSKSELRDFIEQFLEYIDGYATTAEGKLSLALARSQSTAGLPEVDESVMVEPLHVAPDDWSQTFNETQVKFTDPARNYEPNAKTWRDRGNFQVTGQHYSEVIDRPWVTNEHLAQFMATALGRISALPEVTGELTLRRTALFDDLMPGSLFKINYPPRGYEGLVCRVIDRSVRDPARPVYRVGFKIDRSYLLNGLEVFVPGPTFAPASDDSPEQISHYRILELPVALCPEGRLSMAALVARPEGVTSGYRLHLGRNYDLTGLIAASSYFVLDSSGDFAMHGVVITAHGLTSTIDEEGIEVEMDGADTEIDEQSAFDAMGNELLVFVNGEVMSVIEAEVVGISRYKLKVIRARYASPMETHAEGDDVFIIRSSLIRPLLHSHFQVGNQAAFKVQAFTGRAAAELEFAPQTTVDIEGRIYKEPAPTDLRCNGQGQGATYGAGEDIALEWTENDGGQVPFRMDLASRLFVVEFYNAAGDTLLGSEESLTANMDLSNAELVTLLGGEVSFLAKVKLRTVLDWAQVDSETANLNVTKI